MTTLNLTVPGVPDTLNRWVRLHWGVRDGQRKEWAEKMAPLLYKAGCRRTRPMFLSTVSLTLHYRISGKGRRKRPDLDNLVPKQLVDALIGYAFEDDSAVRLLVQSIEYDADREETIICVKPLVDAA